MHEQTNQRLPLTAESIRHLVDDRRQPLMLVCRDMEISIVLGARLLEQGRKDREIRRAFGQREKD